VLSPNGPGTPFTVLFDAVEEAGTSLPADYQRWYDGDWVIPPAVTRPYVYVNFVVSHDGRVSYGHPDYIHGGHVADGSVHDKWLMGLLRARADVVVMGDGTLRADPGHRRTPDYIYPDDAEAFAELRKEEGREPVAIEAFLSLTGELNPDAAVLRAPEARVVLATTTAGEAKARRVRAEGQLDVHVLGEDSVDPLRLLSVLAEEYGAGSVLCEGGPYAYGSLLAAGAVDEAFISLSPLVVGSPGPGEHRPSLVEGVTFLPPNAPRLIPVSVRRADHLLFLRSRYQAPDSEV